jgi:hypothetical protein
MVAETSAAAVVIISMVRNESILEGKGCSMVMLGSICYVSVAP